MFQRVLVFIMNITMVFSAVGLSVFPKNSLVTSTFYTNHANQQHQHNETPIHNDLPSEKEATIKVAAENESSQAPTKDPEKTAREIDKKQKARAPANNQSPESQASQDYTMYYLNEHGEIKHAKVYKNGRLIQIREYSPYTTIENADDNLLRIFNLDSNGYVKSATEFEKGTQLTFPPYKLFLPKQHIFPIDKTKTPQIITTQNSYDRVKKYQFYFNCKGDWTEDTTYQKKFKRVTAQVSYYPKTEYGNHTNYRKYVYHFNSKGDLTTAKRYKEGSGQLTARISYYPNTKYGKRVNNRKHTYYFNSKGYLTRSTKFKKGSKEILAKYEYAPKTVYGKHSSKVSSVLLNVPLVHQLPELPTGCEITAVTMMLQYKGVKNISKIKLANEMPYHQSDPTIGYVGNPYSKRGWTVYPSALTGLVKKYAGSAMNLTGTNNANLEKQLRNGKPVVVWGSPIHGFTVHALILTGYDDQHYYYNDPWTNQKDVKISKSTFNQLWSALSKRAITY